MPLKKCTNAEGKSGWQWGSGGCQVAENDLASKKQAIRVGLKVEGPQRFAEIMKKEKGAFVDYEGLSLARAVLKEGFPRGYIDQLMNTVASFFSKSSDDFEKKDGDELIEGNFDPDHPGVAPSDMIKGDLDDHTSDHTKLIVPKFNKLASPESSPSQEVPSFIPPTRQEMDGENEENVDETKVGDIGKAETEARLEYLEDMNYISIAFLSSETRNKIPLEDFADPARRAYPITTQQQVMSALRLLHFSDNPSMVKKNIVKIALRKNFSLPSHISHEEACIV